MTRRRRLLFQQLDARLPLDASGEFADFSNSLHQNPISALDVNDNGEVTALDALLVINSLEEIGDQPLQNLDRVQGDFVDVNGDDMASAVDALLVINRLNAELGTYSAIEPTHDQQERVGEVTTRPPSNSIAQGESTGVSIDIQVENLSELGGLFATPFWVAAHDGSFDLGRFGGSASETAGLEALAEEGDVSGVRARFAAESSGVDSVITGPNGFGGAPVFDPEEIQSTTIDVADPHVNRYFSFASMVIPSNDAFIANLAQRQFSIFDSEGGFLGETTIVIYGQEVFDAGTEVNGLGVGAAFSAVGGDASDENGVITRSTGLNDFVGSELPTGENLESAFNNRTPIARITISASETIGDPTDLEDDGRGPLAKLVPQQEVTDPSEPFSIQVDYSDAGGIDPASIDTGDIGLLRLVGGTRQLIRPSSVTTDGDADFFSRQLRATYTFDRMDSELTGGLDASDNGTYRVYALNGQVTDANGNTSRFDRLGDVEIEIATESTDLLIEVENLAPASGLFATPFWVGVHDGTFDLGTLGESASNFGGLEAIAEGGDVDGLLARFDTDSTGSDGVITAPEGFAGAPVFDPGDVATFELSVSNTITNQFFSFASMVIPSNDAFFANLNSLAYELFDQDGNFSGPLTINLTGEDVWDAGTEVNEVGGGAAFSAAGGESADENGVILPHQGLSEFADTGLPTESDLLFAELGRTPLIRITISLADSPSNPADTSGPVAELSQHEGSRDDNGNLLIEVNYYDPSGVDISSIDARDLLVLRSVAGQTETLFTANAEVLTPTQASPTTVTVRYTVEASDEPSTDAVYQIFTVTNEVRDTLDNGSLGHRIAMM